MAPTNQAEAAEKSPSSDERTKKSVKKAAIAAGIFSLSTTLFAVTGVMREDQKNEEAREQAERIDRCIEAVGNSTVRLSDMTEGERQDCGVDNIPSEISDAQITINTSYMENQRAEYIDDAEDFNVANFGMDTAMGAGFGIVAAYAAHRTAESSQMRREIERRRAESGVYD